MCSEERHLVDVALDGLRADIQLGGGIDDRQAGGRAAQRMDDVGAVGVLGEVAAGVSLERGQDRRVVDVGRQDDGSRWSSTTTAAAGPAPPNCWA
jgi:hypothetical protein